MHMRNFQVRGLCSVALLGILAASAQAAEDAEKLIIIKTYSGLEFKGELKYSSEENMVIATPYGERTFRRSDVISTRTQLSPDERENLKGLLAYAKKNAGAGAAQAENAARATNTELADLQRATQLAREGRGERNDRLDRAERADARGFGESMPAGTTSYERMSRALDKKITIELVDTPLTEAIDLVNAITHLNIIVNPKVRDSKLTINLKVNDMDAATVIKWMTRLSETYAEIKDQAIWITDKPSKEAENEEKNDIALLAASMHATVDLPPDGVELTDADRTKIALQLWEAEQPKVHDFPGPDLSIGADHSAAANPFAPGN
jgi:hypothetical protein